MNYTFLVDFQAMESGWNFVWVFKARVGTTLFLRPPHWVQGGPIRSLPQFTSFVPLCFCPAMHGSHHDRFPCPSTGLLGWPQLPSFQASKLLCAFYCIWKLLSFKCHTPKIYLLESVGFCPFLRLRFWSRSSEHPHCLLTQKPSP